VRDIAHVAGAAAHRHAQQGFLLGHVEEFVFGGEAAGRVVDDAADD
jgi:hypothetical protein